MKTRTALIVLSLSFLGIHQLVTAQVPSNNAPGTPGASDPPPTPAEKAVQVWQQRGNKLLDENPDVLGILPSPETGEIIIETDRPEMIPKELDGVPVKIVIPQVLPPPKGVIVLRRGGIIERREDLDECPDGFHELRRYRWRFCQPPGNSEIIPSRLMMLPIAGIPFEEADKIYQRNKDKLGDLPGVTGIGLRREGIEVETDQPGLVPTNVEGLPVKTVPPAHRQYMDHTLGLPAIRNPFRANVLVTDTNKSIDQITNQPIGYEILTLGGIILSGGRPWGLTAAHGIANACASVCQPCDPPDLCPANAKPTLNECPHYDGPIFAQPPTDVGDPIQSAYHIGHAARFSQQFGSIIAPYPKRTDAAAIFLDNDAIEGNGSFPIDRSLETYGSTFKGSIMEPMMPGSVVLVGARKNSTNMHILAGSLTATDDDVNVQANRFNCWYPGSIKHTNQVKFHSSIEILRGNSGGLILNATGDVIGLHTWGLENLQTHKAFDGGGPRIDRVKQILGFDSFYGTQTMKDNTIGVFRSSTTTWYIDNGNSKLDATPCTSAAPIATRDQCFVYGISTDRPITGDWDNAAVNSPSNDFTVGYYRVSTDPNVFFRSNTNPPGNDIPPLPTGPAAFGYQPVTGKWQGNNGASNATSKVGVYRPSTGGFYLDSGNNAVEACGTDYCFFLTAFLPNPNDIPLAGDWNNDGIVTIGIFRPGGQFGGSDTFYLSNVNPFLARNNGVINSWDYTIQGGPGSFGYLPLVGDWTGTGGEKLGVFRPSTGGWYLDNGNRVFAGCQEDLCPQSFGQLGDRPAAIGKSIVKGN
jgi:hypothetical protein